MDAKASGEKSALLTEGYSDRVYLLLLLVCVLPLRGWLLFNTEVTARDSIGYIRFALDFDHRPFKETVGRHAQHPGYSMCIWVASVPLRVIYGDTDADIMRIAAQVVSGIAALLLLIPMYHIGKELLGRRVAFWGTLLFQFLPVSGQHLSDGVSEPVFLLLATMALWMAMIGFRLASDSRSLTIFDANSQSNTSGERLPLPGRCYGAFALSGLFGGLAYWTRPEGAFVVAAAALALLGKQLFVTRSRWKEFVAQGMSLAVPALLLAGTYFWVTGTLTTKLAPRFIVGTEVMSQIREGEAFPLLSTKPSHRGALFASGFASFIPQAKDYPTRFARAGRTFFAELVQGFHYLGCWGFALGVVWFGPAFLRVTGFWVILLYGLIQTVTLFLLAIRAFYISDRHVMVLVLPSCFLMAAGFLEAGRRIQQRLAAFRLGRDFTRLSIPTLLAAGMVLLCIPKTAQSLHGNRQGNHLIGLWLKDQLKDGDLIVDDHCWSHYYAGQLFLEGREPPVSPDYQPLCYVVITRSKIRDVAAARLNAEQSLLEANARLVYHWPLSSSPELARVVVYALPRDAKKYPWNVAPR